MDDLIAPRTTPHEAEELRLLAELERQGYEVRRLTP